MDIKGRLTRCLDVFEGYFFNCETLHAIPVSEATCIAMLTNSLENGDSFERRKPPNKKRTISAPLQETKWLTPKCPL